MRWWGRVADRVGGWLWADLDFGDGVVEPEPEVEVEPEMVPPPEPEPYVPDWTVVERDGVLVLVDRKKEG